MALTRVTGKVFGGEAPLDEIGQFGSALLGTKLNTQDVATIQALEAYSQGWGSAVIPSRNFPPMEEVTGVLKTISYQACYSLQAGVPVYDIATDYGVGDIVKVVSGNNDTLTFYISQTTPNIGQSLSDITYWKPAIFLASAPIGVPQYTMNPNAVLPSNCMWLEGQSLLINDFQILHSIYLDTYNLPNDNIDTTLYFRLPDFRGRYIYGLEGSGSFGYIAAGLPNLGLMTTWNGSHHHGGNTLNVTGNIYSRANNKDHPGTIMGGTGIFSYANYQSGGSAYCCNNNIFTTDPQGRRDVISVSTSGKWSGQTDDAGAHQHSVTSSNPIVGSTNTVKVDGIKLRFYTRVK